MKHRISLITLIITTAFFTNSCGGKFQFVCGVSDVSQIGINHLQPLVVAMEEYKKDNGRYPEYGTDLIPKYLNKVPVLASNDESYDESKVDVLRNERLGSDKAIFEKDGSNFSLSFYPTDDRFCLTGRNNICEYTSDTKKWGCYQH
jgi:hypothetical protein